MYCYNYYTVYDGFAKILAPLSVQKLINCPVYNSVLHATSCAYYMQMWHSTLISFFIFPGFWERLSFFIFFVQLIGDAVH